MHLAINRWALLASVFASTACTGPASTRQRAPTLAPLTNCPSGRLADVATSYDPVTDTTTASVSRVFKPGYRLIAQAQHKSRTSTDSVMPRVWIHSTDIVAASHNPDLAVLVDDSVRFRWKQTGFGVRELDEGVLVGKVTVWWVGYQPPAAEFARFSMADKATVVFGEVRGELNQREIRPFAELRHWATCAADRPEPETRK